MLSLSVMYAMQGAPFLAFVQVIVYTGAVLMLFLFVVMLIGVNSAALVGDTSFSSAGNQNDVVEMIRHVASPSNNRGRSNWSPIINSISCTPINTLIHQLILM